MDGSNEQIIQFALVILQVVALALPAFAIYLQLADSVEIRGFELTFSLGTLGMIVVAFSGIAVIIFLISTIDLPEILFWASVGLALGLGLLGVTVLAPMVSSFIR